jgi:hypothetical protein
LETKIKPNAAGHIFSKQISGNSEISMSIYLLSNGSLSFGIDRFTYGGWTTINSGVGAIDFGQWSHVAFVYNSTNRGMQIFVNGAQVASGTLTTNPLSGNGAIFIGANRNGAVQFNGLMDEVRIWTTARTVTQINTNKNSEVNPSSAGLAAYYTFNNNNGLQAVDTSPTKRNASFAGGLTEGAWTGFVGRPLTVSVTDIHGNTTTAAEVIVLDKISPEARTKDITVYLDVNGLVTITPEMVDNGSTDNCNIVQMALDTISFNFTKLGDHTLTLTTIDASGNQSSATAVVTVEDNIPPVIACPENIIVSNDPGQCDAVVSYEEVTMSDNSAVMGNVLTNGDFETGTSTGWSTSGSIRMNNGTTVPFFEGEATLPISDNFDLLMESNGQITSQPIILPSNIVSAKISWKDRIQNHMGTFYEDMLEFRVELLNEGMSVIHEIYSTNPDDPLIQMGPNSREFDLTNVIQTLVNQTVYLRFRKQDIFYYLKVNLDDIIFEIKSMEAIQTAGLPSGSVFPVGTTTNTFKVTDAGNNTSSCSFDVTVEDDELPVAVAQNVTVYLDSDGNASITAEEVDNESTDNCGIASLSLSKTSFTCEDVGENEVVLTVTDVNNLIGTATATITVVDEINPVVAAQNIIVYLDENGQAEIAPEMADNGTYDNCDFELAVSQSAFDCALAIPDITATEILSVVERNYAGRTVTFSNVDINGTGENTFRAEPGSAVSISLNWQSQYTSPYCPGCVQQFYFGIKDIGITCLYSGGTTSNIWHWQFIIHRPNHSRNLCHPVQFEPGLFLRTRIRFVQHKFG